MTTEYKIPSLPEEDLPVQKVIVEELESTKQRIIQVLNEFGISIKEISCKRKHMLLTESLSLF